jgi:uncharacterized membrane protein YqgA involved in biofilm formation
MLLGALVNGLVIIVCSLAGCFIIRGIPKRFEGILMQAIGLSVVFIGLKGAFDNKNFLFLILSMVFGGLIGELINIDGWMKRFGAWFERKMGSKASGKGNFAQGFVSATLIFCVGSMAIVGALQSGLQGKNEILFSKSVLDGTMSIILSASTGIGVLFASVPTFLYEGAIALAAGAVKALLTAEMISEMSSVGSLLIAAIGFNFLGIKEIKVANLIPAMFLPCVFLAIQKLV